MFVIKDNNKVVKTYESKKDLINNYVSFLGWGDERFYTIHNKEDERIGFMSVNRGGSILELEGVIYKK